MFRGTWYARHYLDSLTIGRIAYSLKTSVSSVDEDWVEPAPADSAKRYQKRETCKKIEIGYVHAV